MENELVASEIRRLILSGQMPVSNQGSVLLRTIAGRRA